MNAHELRDARLLDGLLESLLDLPDAERARRLGNLQASRPQLATRLAHLLELAEQDTTTLLPAGALQTGLLDDLLSDDAPLLSAGDHFCGYRIEALTGRGGMSDVYRATREYDGFAATVALKLIHHQGGHAIRGDILRHEQRALARLEHPGIARFIDAGEGPQGELWFAMEFVDGEAILTHADRRQLGLRARAELLIALCRALEHAHARRLVHGDVKSANVLVDTEQRLRLVDFGIASDASLDQETRLHAFTPECAAPEQLAGGDITTATDVFQVGALAYRLLSGCSHLRSGLPSIDVTALPVAPSIALSGASVDADANARARSLPDAFALRRALAGDADAIVRRCMQPDPERRYAGCTELREDLEAWLAMRRVRARAGGPWLRLGKFLRRHARAAAVIALVAIVAIAASAVSLVHLRQAQLERLAEAERAIQVERFLSETFRAASPYLRDDNGDPLATIAALGADLLRDNPDLDARTRARLGLSLAQLQLARGEHAQARALLDAADGALVSAAADAPGLRAELLSARAGGEADADETEAAIASQREAIALLQAAAAPPLQRALAQGQLGDLLRRAGRLDEAGAAFAAAMPRVLLDFADAGSDRVRVVDRYVRFLVHSGRFDGLRELRAQMAARVEGDGPGSLADAELSSVLAEIDSALVGPNAAAIAFERTAKRFEALLGERHPRVARALTDACVSHLESGQMAIARAHCLRGLDVYQRSSGPDSLNAAIAASNLATIAYNTGSLLDADGYGSRSLAVFERGQQPYPQVHSRLLQGRIAIAHGWYEQALRHLDSASSMRARSLPDNEVMTLEIGQQRAFALIGLGRLEDAGRQLAAIEPILGRMLPADHARDRAWTAVAQAQLAGARGELAGLDSAIASALDEYRATPGRNDLEHGWLQAELALAARSADREDRALELAEHAVALMTPESSGVHWANAWALRRLAGGAADAGQDGRARALLRDQQVETAQARAYLVLP